ncbi:MAG: 5'-methylthioadenosine/S-adenosylhomocysteine nucleosidase [Bacteroides sp.]|nr:5'-methylthioadenosine/S-adenosylhomocysteine nucleosidase [Bacillota bacterium]MCM1394246.1 5'-methylthioadenosine/S-adenosylhomocysteine nucleosidase [[Eubacterium] siraeum]MCM1455253.1 5'-methylthioadenosine/S-adenosylhomocysteine nucleosidase [Bacteroides sp.]
MKIGIITAMAEEMLPIYKKLGNVQSEEKVRGAEIRKIALGDNVIYLATGGVGEINSAATVQLLADLYGVERILNFGFVGSLNSEIGVGELVIADRVCHYQYDVSVLDNVRVGQYSENKDIYFYLDGALVDCVNAALNAPLRKVAVASGDAFVASSQKKKTLREEFGCDICEMELAGLTIACLRNEIPLLSIKVVSDRADDGAYVSFTDVVQKGLSKYEEILPAVIKAVSTYIA